ncbi:hypothetical protein D3C86_1025110 [compost metagenome]
MIPNSIANSEQPSTAAYKRASSPSFLQAHIQFADNEIPFKPSLIGAQTMFDNDSAIAFLLPATGSIKAAIGAWPIEVAIPSFPK